MSTANLQIPEASAILAKRDDLPQLPDIASAMLRLLNQQKHDTEALARLLPVIRSWRPVFYGLPIQVIRFFTPD